MAYSYWIVNRPKDTTSIRNKKRPRRRRRDRVVKHLKDLLILLKLVIKTLEYSGNWFEMFTSFQFEVNKKRTIRKNLFDKYKIIVHLVILSKFGKYSKCRVCNQFYTLFIFVYIEIVRYFRIYITTLLTVPKSFPVLVVCIAAKYNIHFYVHIDMDCARLTCHEKWE